MMKKIILILLVFLIFSPATYAIDEGFDVTIGNNLYLKAHFDNCTKINQVRIKPGCFTTIHNHSFHWENAYRLDYKNNEGKIDYFIIWECNATDDYDVIHELNSYSNAYSDYTLSGNVVYMELRYSQFQSNTYASGIILDTQNISYTEDDLVHGILRQYSSALTNSNDAYDSSQPVSYYAPSYSSNHYIDSKSDQWDMAINDPDWYYDHYDYGDDGDIDDYLDEYYYW